MMKRKWLILPMLLAALTMVAGLALDQRMIVRRYTVKSDKINTPVRLAVLTDLHEHDYGPDGEMLILAMEAQKTDAVLIAGDWFNDADSYDYGASILNAIARRWPCWFVTGNHEYWPDKGDHLIRLVEACGVNVLNMESDVLTVRGQKLRICGIPDPYATIYSDAPDEDTQLALAAADVQPDEFAILIAHRPETIEQYAKYPFDLVVAGHAHGGQVRIPGLINGLYAPNQGWFPKYAGGQYRVGDTAMIVSRGLWAGNQLPRIFNRPELVLVDLVGH